MNRHGQRHDSEKVVTAHYLVHVGSIAGSRLDESQFEHHAYRKAWAKAKACTGASRTWLAEHVLDVDTVADLREVRPVNRGGVEKHAQRLRNRAAFNRARERMLQAIAVAAADDTVDYDLEALAKGIDEARGLVRSSRPISSRDGYEVLQQVAQLYTAANPAPRAIPSPWPVFNDATGGGWAVGAAHLVGAPTSGRKTTSCMNCVIEAARNQGKRCLVWTLEDDTNALGARMLANVVEVPHSLGKIVARRFPRQSSSTAFRQEVERHNWASRIRFIDRRGVNGSDLIAGLRAEPGHFDLIFVDFLQLVVPDSLRIAEHIHLQRVMEGLATVAQERNAAVLVAVQLSQGYMNRRGDSGPWPAPQLGDIRGGSAIAQAAHTVLMLEPPNDREAQAAEHPYTAHIRKCKAGVRRSFTLTAQTRHDRLVASDGGAS